MTVASMTIYGAVCTCCRETLIAPRCSHYVSDRHIQHRWSCETCWHEFDTSDHLLCTEAAMKFARKGHPLLRLLLMNKESGGHSVRL